MTTETKKYRYTVLVAFVGSSSQLVVEANTTFEALALHMKKMQTFGDDREEIISMTIIQKDEIR